MCLKRCIVSLVSARSFDRLDGPLSEIIETAHCRELEGQEIYVYVHLVSNKCPMHVRSNAEVPT